MAFLDTWPRMWKEPFIYSRQFRNLSNIVRNPFYFSVFGEDASRVVIFSTDKMKQNVQAFPKQLCP